MVEAFLNQILLAFGGFGKFIFQTMRCGVVNGPEAVKTLLPFAAPLCYILMHTYVPKLARGADAGNLATMTDVELLTNALRSRFPTPPPKTGEGWDGNLALNVLDCVLSLNRNYDRVVLPRVEGFARKHPDVSTVTELQQIMSSYATPADFVTVELSYKDAARAKTLEGVVSYLLDIQRDFAGSTEKDRLRAWAEWARPGDFSFTGVRGFGLAGFQYIRLLLGANTVKPDKWICKFVADSIGRNVTPVEALFLLERAAKRANLRIRDIDSAIWNQGARRNSG
jgi:hypothetical protein